MNVNRVIVAGNITKDPELKFTQSGQPYAQLSIATNRYWKDQAGNKQEEVTFHNVTAWGTHAENIAKYLKKGSLLFVEGRLQNRSWEDQQGNKQYRTGIVAEQVQFGPRRDGGAAQEPEPASPQGAWRGPEDRTPSRVAQERGEINAPSATAPTGFPIQVPPGEERIDIKDIPF